MGETMNRPAMIIQSDWDEALKEKNSEAWISYKVYGKPSVSSTLHSKGISSDGTPDISSTAGFQIKKVYQRMLALQHDSSTRQYWFISPSQSYTGIHSKSITGLDVTKGGLGVSVCTANKLHVWDSATGMSRRALEGHLGDVYTCRFFPSGIVVLSGGVDMQLKIWSAENGQCPVTMTGHRGAITDTAIVDRGRNVISTSKDGTARLWDCGQSSCLSVLADVSATINSCSINIAPEKFELGKPVLQPSEREIGTSDKLLLLACEDQKLHGVGVQNRQIVFSSTLPSAVNCVAFLTPDQYAAGCQDGHLIVGDIRWPKEPLRQWLDSNSPILSLLPYQDGVFTGKGDGTCTYYNMDDTKCIHLTGSDCDAIYKISSDSTHLYTACRDGVIRKYNGTLLATAMIS